MVLGQAASHSAIHCIVQGAENANTQRMLLLARMTMFSCGALSNYAPTIQLHFFLLQLNVALIGFGNVTCCNGVIYEIVDVHLSCQPLPGLLFNVLG